MSNLVHFSASISTANDNDNDLIFTHTYIYIPSFVLVLKTKVDNLEMTKLEVHEKF